MWSVINLAAHLPPLGVASNVHMHVSLQGHCDYLDFAHTLSSSAGVHFLTTSRFCWWGQSGRETVSHLRMSRRDLPSLCAQWKSHHRQSALQRTSHCSGLIFFWYRRWVLGWWPSSLAALGSCGLSVPPAARLKWRNVCAILFLQEFKQHDAIWQKNIPIAKTATFFRYLNFCHFFTQKGLALGMLLISISNSTFLRAFKSKFSKAFKWNQFCADQCPLTRENAYKQMFGLSLLLYSSLL